MPFSPPPPPIKKSHSLTRKFKLLAGIGGVILIAMCVLASNAGKRIQVNQTATALSSASSVSTTSVSRNIGADEPVPNEDEIASTKTIIVQPSAISITSTPSIAQI